jgi:hypothetical protein
MPRDYYTTPAIRCDESGMWVLREYHEAEIRRLRGAFQTILDMPCPFGREGDPLGAAQRIASESFNDRPAGL